jgi:hypothetical protein
MLGQGAAVAQDVAGQAGQAAKGQLKILGEHVERLVLFGEGTGTEDVLSGDALKRPIDLTPGTYRVRDLAIKGGYRSSEEVGQVEVKAGGVTELKAGAPLTQGLTVERQGKMFRLGYELKGVGGEMYTSENQATPPEFAVYKGDKKVGGGQFEYG